MKPPIALFAGLFVFSLVSTASSQTIFEGEGNWMDDNLWDLGVPVDNDNAVINGICTITEDTAPQNSQNPSRVAIGEFEEGTLRVVGGTLSGAHGGNNGIFVGVGEGGNGTLIIEQGASFRSQGGGMVVRIGDEDGGVGKVVVGGELLNYKFFELINGTLEMRSTGVNAKFNQNDTTSYIGPDGTLSYVIDGPNVGSLKKADGTGGLVVEIDEGSNLEITLGGAFSVGDSWLLMRYTSLSGEFSQGGSFTNHQGYTFNVDYGSGDNSDLVLTLTSDEERPKILSYTADPSAASSGDPVTLAWNVDKFTTLDISGVGDVTAQGGNGSVVVNPTETTTYTLTVDFDDVIVTQDVTVIVDAQPVINAFSVAPEVVAPGQEATLSWDTSGGTEVTIAPGIGAVDAVGSMLVSAAETTEYQITAKNGAGEVTEEATLTVDAIGAARIRSYDAAGDNQTDGAWLDSVAFRNYDMKNMELTEIGDGTANTILTKAFSIIDSTNDTGGDNGDGFPFTQVSFELWFKTVDLDSVRQVIFETGGGANGTSLTIDEENLYFWHSKEDERTIDVTLPLGQINIEDDFVHVVMTLDQEMGKASIYARGAAGGSASESAEGEIGSPSGRSAIFRWSNFGADVNGALGGSAGDPPIEIDSFYGQVAIINVYDRPLTEEEAEEAFCRTVIEKPDGDSDGDGLPDFWEEKFLGNLDSGADDDNDADTLKNSDELAAGTDPSKADTDEDNLTDAEEVNGDPKTDPKVADTDGDGRTDGEEVKGAVTSDPTKVDTDDDGFSDSFEVAQGSNPRDANDIPDDPLGEPVVITNELGTLPSFNGFEGDQDTLDATFRACVDFDEKADPDIEVIFETGGATIGFSLVYEEGSKLVLRAAGDGGFTLAVVEYVLTAAEIAGGNQEVTWTFDVDDGNGDSTIALFVNGVNVGSDTQTLSNDWSGSNAASFGAASTGVAGDGENGNLTGVDFFSGTIDEGKGLLFYSDRLFEGGAPPTENFAIIAVSHTNGQTTIEWTSAPGASYTVEGSAGLNEWLEIEDGIESGGATTEFTDENLPAGTTIYFYRVSQPE